MILKTYPNICNIEGEEGCGGVGAHCCGVVHGEVLGVVWLAWVSVDESVVVLCWSSSLFLFVSYW